MDEERVRIDSHPSPHLFVWFINAAYTNMSKYPHAPHPIFPLIIPSIIPIVKVLYPLAKFAPAGSDRYLSCVGVILFPPSEAPQEVDPPPTSTGTGRYDPDLLTGDGMRVMLRLQCARDVAARALPVADPERGQAGPLGKSPTEARSLPAVLKECYLSLSPTIFFRDSPAQEGDADCAMAAFLSLAFDEQGLRSGLTGTPNTIV